MTLPMFLTLKHSECEAVVRVVSGGLIMACMLRSGFLSLSSLIKTASQPLFLFG